MRGIKKKSCLFWKHIYTNKPIFIKNTKIHWQACPHTFGHQVELVSRLSYLPVVVVSYTTSLKLNFQIIIQLHWICANLHSHTCWRNLPNIFRISPTITADVQILNGTQATNTDSIRGEKTPETQVEATLLHISKNIPLISMSAYYNTQSYWSHYWGSTGLGLPLK